MKKIITINLLSFLLAFNAQSQIITTIAGNGTAAYTGDGGQAVNATFNTPNQLAFDAAGNLYVAEDYNHVIRKISTTGVVSTVAGNGTMGFSGDGGPAINAQLNRSAGIAVDAAGNLYICDADNHRIRKVNTAGIISTIAGTGVDGHTGDGGPATAANIGFVTNVQVDAAGNVYFAAQSNSFSVRKINTSGIITTIAGTGVNGNSGDGGPATAAQLNAVSAICFDPAGNLYISVFYGFRIKKVSTSGIITTIAGTGAFGSNGDGGPATSAQVFYPYGLVSDGAGNIYFCEAGNNKIRKIDASGIITTFAGLGGFSGGYSGDGGPAISASFNHPAAIVRDAAGNFIIGDYANNVIRKINMSATGINDISYPDNANSLVYPNPNNGNFSLKLKHTGEYRITNTLGETIKAITIKDINQPISVDGLSEGVYFITGKQLNQKIIVNQ